MGKVVNLPPFETWDTGLSPVAQAAKIIEEAAEVVDAAANSKTPEQMRKRVAYEVMDVMQACCNMLQVCGIDRYQLWEAQRLEQDTQRERGRL